MTTESTATTSTPPCTLSLARLWVALTTLAARSQSTSSCSVGRGDPPLAEHAHQRRLGVDAADEELLLGGEERDVAVVVQARGEAVVDQDVEHPSAQRVLVGGRREAGNGRRVAHRSTVTVGQTAPVTAPSGAPAAATTRPYPLGLHLRADGDGADAAVFAAHAEQVEVCLLDDDGAETRTTLPRCTDGVWHGHVPGARAGQRYGLRVHGPWDPTAGHRHNPAKLLIDPYARAVTGEIRWGQPVFGHVVDDQWRPQDGPAAHGGARWQDSTDSLGHVPTGRPARHRPTRRAAPVRTCRGTAPSSTRRTCAG